MFIIVQGFILDDFRWSFSRIETFERCALCFYMQYIQCLKGLPGCFGQFGTINHDLLEAYAKGELEDYELANEYKNRYGDVVTEPFPPNKYVDLGDKYYNQGLEYFSSFEGFEEFDITGVEEEYEFKIGEYNFVGLIDLETPDSIIDHKTKGEQHLKRLTKKHNKEDYVQMLDGRYTHKDNWKQLYIYSIPYFVKYKTYPKFLSLNMVRINDWYSIEFNEKHFEESQQWVLTQIESIYQTNEFLKGNDVSDFWCGFVCSQRLNCKHSNSYLGLEQ